MNVKPFEAAWPLFVSVTVTAPGACAGETAVTDVPPQLLTAAVVPPKDTEGKAGVHTKPVPVRTTLSPPELLPVAGAIDVSVAVPLATPPRLASW